MLWGGKGYYTGEMCMGADDILYILPFAYLGLCLKMIDDRVDV